MGRVESLARVIAPVGRKPRIAKIVLRVSKAAERVRTTSGAGIFASDRLEAARMKHLLKLVVREVAALVAARGSIFAHEGNVVERPGEAVELNGPASVSCCVPPFTFRLGTPRRARVAA